MAKQLVTHEKTKLSRKERKALASIYQNMVRGDEVRADETEKWPIPTQGLTYRPEFWSLPVKRPYHRGTGFELAAANPFSAAYIHDPAGPVVGMSRCQVVQSLCSTRRNCICGVNVPPPIHLFKDR